MGDRPSREAPHHRMARDREYACRGTDPLDRPAWRRKGRIAAKRPDEQDRAGPHQQAADDPPRIARAPAISRAGVSPRKGERHRRECNQADERVEDGKTAPPVERPSLGTAGATWQSACPQRRSQPAPARRVASPGKLHSAHYAFVSRAVSIPAACGSASWDCPASSSFLSVSRCINFLMKGETRRTPTPIATVIQPISL